MRHHHAPSVRRIILEKLEERVVLSVSGLGSASEELQSVIVRFNDEVTDPAEAAQILVADHAERLDNVYSHAIKGFSASLHPTAIELLRNHPLVKYVEPNLQFQITAQALPTGINRIEADLNPTADIDQGQAPEAPIDIDIAILDTGIDPAHPDLNVYATGSQNFVTGLPASSWQDGHGHGTHVAGIAAALDNEQGVVGVAPGARLWALKVLNDAGTGTVDEALAAVEYVTAHADEIEVANMSFGEYGQSTAFREAIQTAVAAGVVFVAAAGNDSTDILPTDPAGEFFPAAYPEVLTVSAMADYDGQPGGSGGNWLLRILYGADDCVAPMSNYSARVLPDNPVVSPGRAIDLVLPGIEINSTNIGGGYTNKSGTSMAAPHAAGLAALFITENSIDVDLDGQVEYGDVNQDGLFNEADVYVVRQSLINRGVQQTDPIHGLANGGDPDGYREPIGWAGPVSTNQPPDAVGDAGYTPRDTPVVLDLLNNDSDTDGDPLWVRLGSQPGHGSVVINADHTVVYTPDLGYSGDDEFTYIPHDGKDGGLPVTVSLQVGAANTAPMAVDDAYSTAEESQLIVDAPGVLENDSDDDGDALTILLLAGPANGTLDLGADGSFAYTPEDDFSGIDSFTYRAFDGTDYSSPTTVTITVNPVNDAPVAVPDGYSVQEDETLTVAGSGVLGNDTDVDGDTLSAELVSDVSHGILALIGDGSFIYTPDPGYSGEDSFTYKAVDDDPDPLASNVVKVTITVTEQNDLPIAVVGVSYEGDEGSNITLDASASYDPDGSIVTYEWDFDNDGQYDDDTGATTTFNSTDDGEFTVGVKVTDNLGGTDTATTTVTVNNVAPTAATGGPYTVDEGSNVTLSASTSTDPGDDIVLYEWDLDNNGVYGDSTGATATFSSTDDGEFIIGVRVTDDDGASDTVATTVTVNNVAPTADAGGPYTTDEGVAVTLTAAGSSDPGNDINLYEWDLDNDDQYDDATGVTAAFSSAIAGTYTVGVRVTDDDGAAGIDTATVTVNSASATMNVVDLEGSSTSINRNKWRATVTIKVEDSGGGLVSGATVQGTWSDGDVGTASTNSSGIATVTSGNVSKGSTISFTVNSISHATLTYKPEDNRDEGGDYSNGTTITVAYGDTLRAAGRLNSAAPAANLTLDQANATAAQAMALWSQQLVTVPQINVTMADLPAGILGWAYDNTITLDVNADGAGWHTHQSASSAGQYDLLTVVSHEIGHLLGYDHSYHHEDLMAARLPVGTRRLPGLETNMMEPALIASLPNLQVDSSTPVAELPTRAKSLDPVAETSFDLFLAPLVVDRVQESTGSPEALEVRMLDDILDEETELLEEELLDLLLS